MVDAKEARGLRLRQLAFGDDITDVLRELRLGEHLLGVLEGQVSKDVSATLLNGDLTLCLIFFRSAFCMMFLRRFQPLPDDVKLDRWCLDSLLGFLLKSMEGIDSPGELHRVDGPIRIPSKSDITSNTPAPPNPFRTLASTCFLPN